MKFKYGWKPSAPDHRDLKFWPKKDPMQHVEVDFRQRGDIPYVRNQKNLGGCTGHGWRGVYKNELILEHKPIFEPSPLFIYYKERELDGTIDQDAGSCIRTGAKALNQFGVCSEELWSYDDGPDKFRQDPGQVIDAAALTHQSIKYMQVPQTEQAMKEVLMDGHGICIGFMVYDSFESEKTLKTGNVTVPKIGETIQGGHCVWVCGVSDKRECFIIQNSWGSEVGDKGYFYMPMEFVLDPKFCSDFWTLNLLAG